MTNPKSYFWRIWSRTIPVWPFWSGTKRSTSEKDLSISVGALVGRLYDLLLPQYVNPESPETLKSLNKLCVRLVFCLYAEDSGMFGAPDAFYRYLTSFRTENVRTALIELFKTLDTKPEDRDPYMPENLAAFPYANGGFSEARSRFLGSRRRSLTCC